MTFPFLGLLRFSVLVSWHDVEIGRPETETHCKTTCLSSFPPLVPAQVNRRCATSDDAASIGCDRNAMAEAPSVNLIWPHNHLPCPLHRSMGGASQATIRCPTGWRLRCERHLSSRSCWTGSVENGSAAGKGHFRNNTAGTAGQKGSVLQHVVVPGQVLVIALPVNKDNVWIDHKISCVHLNLH